MKFKRTIASVTILLGLASGLAACGIDSNSSAAGTSANASEQAAQGQDSLNLDTNQPLHVYNYSQQKAVLQAAEDIEADGENTTTFFFNQGVQNPVFSCASRGISVPESDQLTNPSQVLPDPNEQNQNNGNPGSVIVPQEDPNGLYGGDTTGTYTICLDSKGQQYLMIWEGFDMTVSANAVWNTTTHSVQVLGSPVNLNVKSVDAKSNISNAKPVVNPTPSASGN